MLRGWAPFLASFTVWLAHWALCWLAALVWQGQPAATIAAIVFTVIALAVLSWLYIRFQKTPADEQGLTEWSRRLALMTTVFAGVATLFTLMPALFLG